MPIVVKDFTWEETESMVYVTVPLKGVRATNLDIFTTEEYLKLHYPPYLFECFLNAPVLDQDSSVQIGNGIVLFKLKKKEPALWKVLQHPDAGVKSKKAERRQAAITRSQQRSEEIKATKTEKKREMDKLAVKEQMKLEEEVRQNIKDIKDAEIKQATDELVRWKEEQQILTEKEQEKQVIHQKEMKTGCQVSHETGHAGEDVAVNHNSFSKQIKTAKKGRKNIFETTAGDEPLREMGKIAVNFTPRVFPTAARESTAEKENEWLQKQNEARRIVDIKDAELAEHEKDPVWLRDKGNQLFQAGNYQGAINAYSHGIRLTNKLHSLYSNRSACHLKIGNYMKSAEDAAKALELLTPPVPQNAAARVKAHIRRGTAFCELELYAEGLQDYEAALKINPDHEQLKGDALKIRKIIQGSGEL